MTEKKEILEALENRSKFLKEKYPDDPICKMCSNPVDRTMMGIETVCPYHRMLWDSFMYEAMDKYRDIEKVREEFMKWNKTLSDEERDNIVISMARSPINWEC